jgi:hypothetical protein
LSGADNVNGVYFPIAKTKADYLAKGSRKKISKLRPDLQKVIDDIAPYGNSALVTLNALANTDKHRSLITAIPSIQDMEYVFFAVAISKGLIFGLGNHHQMKPAK